MGLVMKKKPPLGLIPKHIHEQKRIWDIALATYRYMKEGLKVPQEWMEEYNELIKIRGKV